MLLDARINEIYWGLYRFEDGLAVPCLADEASAPADLPTDLLSNSLGRPWAKRPGYC